LDLQISRILHAGYIFESLGTRIAFDPIFENPFSRNCYAFPEVIFDPSKIQNLHLDAVFISHYHDDHCSLDSLNNLDRETPIYIYCLFDELILWIQQLGFSNVHSLKLNVPIDVGAFRVTPCRALDLEVDSIFQIEAEGLKVLNVVDSWIDPDTLIQLIASGPWDLILWPFQTMRELEVLTPSRKKAIPAELPEEWIEQLKALRPRFLVPSSCQFVQESWSWYNHALFPITYEYFEQKMAEILPDTKVIRLNPSRAIHLSKKALVTGPSLDWVQIVGNENVDYDFDLSRRIPSTGEIAARFPELSKAQESEVDTYCNLGLLRKYRSMPPTEESYFTPPRVWRLSLFSQNGEVSHYFYRIQENQIERISESLVCSRCQARKVPPYRQQRLSRWG